MNLAFKFMVIDFDDDKQVVGAGECDDSRDFTTTISNIAYVVGTGKVPDLPSPWGFGIDCSSYDDGDCQNEPQCTKDAGEHCKWSWPYNDQAMWNSKDAKCRCQGV